MKTIFILHLGDHGLYVRPRDTSARQDQNKIAHPAVVGKKFTQKTLADGRIRRVVNVSLEELVRIVESTSDNNPDHDYYLEDKQGRLHQIVTTVGHQKVDVLDVLYEQIKFQLENFKHAQLVPSKCSKQRFAPIA